MKCFFTDVIFECWFCGNLLCKVAVISSASFISWWFGEGCHMRCVTSVRQPCLVDEALMSLSVWPAAVAFQSALQQGHTGTLFYLPYLSRLSSVSSHTLWHVHTAHTHTQGSRPQQQWYRITFFPVSTAEIYGFSLYCFSATAWHWLTLLTWHYSDASVTFTVHSRLSAFLLGLSIVMLDLATHHKAHLPALLIELSCSVCNPLQAVMAAATQG